MNQIDSTPNVAVLQRMLERERSARKQAEQLLEDKSRQLFQSNVELKQFSDAFEREAHRAKAIFDTAAEGIIIFDNDGQIQELNQAALNIFGLSISQEQRLTVCDLVPDAVFCNPVSGQCLASSLQRLAGDRCEIQGRKVDGTRIPIELIVSSFSHGESLCHSGIVRDLTRRKLLESQLAQAQKLESVGQLAAGIAHELNTPIQFVGDNTRFLKESFGALESTLKQIEQIVNDEVEPNDSSQLVQRIKSALNDQDLAFVLDEIPEAIDQTLQGTENVSRIVRAMKVFSHPGTTDFQEVDLNQSLDSTITVSRNEWKYCAEIETSFHAQLPRIYCLPGELNQAFLNIIVNGAHAIQSRASKVMGKLKVSTRFDHETVYIDIQDTGTGIPVAIQSRIFDPFFTTKSVGKGTGQGLSIAYNVIVEMHRGKLTFDSIEGEGTTFHIALPIDPRVNDG